SNLVPIVGSKRAIVVAAAEQRERGEVRGRADAHCEEDAQALDGEEEGERDSGGRGREEVRLRVEPAPRLEAEQADGERAGRNARGDRQRQRAQELGQVHRRLHELHSGVDVKREPQPLQVDRHVRREVCARAAASVRHVVPVERDQRGGDGGHGHDRAGDEPDGVAHDNARDLLRSQVDSRSLTVVRDGALHDAEEDAILHVRGVHVVPVEARDGCDEAELRPEEVKRGRGEADEGDARQHHLARRVRPAQLRLVNGERDGRLDVAGALVEQLLRAARDGLVAADGGDAVHHVVHRALQHLGQLLLGLHRRQERHRRGAGGVDSGVV
ncbi:hypothetical protein T492DRAFT_1114540, partial [Pavlovales sp. CCMP2436]